MSTQDARADGFGPFFRRYTKTWVHAVSTAGLTAFGTLTFVNRWFAVLALGSYVLPPVVLYLRGGRAVSSGPAGDDAGDRELTREGPGRSDAGASSSGEGSRPTVDGEPRSPGPVESRTTPGPDDVGTAPHPDDVGTAPSPVDAGTAPDRDETTTTTRADEDGRDAATDVGWAVADPPTDATLFDAAVVDGSAAYAVGQGGVVIGRGRDDDGWSVVLEDGPGAAGNDLRGVDATDDGAAVWVAGDGGAVGRIDAETGRHTDRSAPLDLTDNLAGIAVGGAAGSETILLINGSGEVLRGRNGSDATGTEWTGPVTPGSGSSLSGIDLVDADRGHCCDTNDGVYATTDGGRSFDSIGVDGADGTLVDVASRAPEDCQTVADDGVCHRFDGATWTPERVADTSLSGIDRDGGRTVVTDEAGSIHERSSPTDDWERTEVDLEGALRGVSIGANRAVAVGDEGALVERVVSGSSREP